MPELTIGISSCAKGGAGGGSGGGGGFTLTKGKACIVATVAGTLESTKGTGISTVGSSGSGGRAGGGVSFTNGNG